MNAWLQAALDTLRGWNWRHSAWACGIGAANLFCNGTPLMGALMPASTLAGLSYNILQFGFPLMLFLGIADRLVDAGRLPAPLAYLLSVALAVTLGVWGIAPLLAPLLGRLDWWNADADRALAFTSFGWLLMGVALYGQWRTSQRAAGQREQAERLHAARQRELAAAQLLALQARVDPELLFERLRVIDTELQAAPDTARHRLSALIDLLRLLQPHHEAAVSPLAREFDAAALLARLLGDDAQNAERLHQHLSADMRHDTMAPSVLLPMLRTLLATPGTTWSLRAAREMGRIRLVLSAQAPHAEQAHIAAQAAQAVPLSLLRERLRAVHGHHAQLDLLNPASLPRFELSWPAS